MSRPPAPPPPPPSRREYLRPSRLERWITNGALVVGVVVIVAACLWAARPSPPPRVCLEARAHTIWFERAGGALEPFTRWTCLRWADPS